MVKKASQHFEKLVTLKSCLPARRSGVVNRGIVGRKLWICEQLSRLEASVLKI